MGYTLLHNSTWIEGNEGAPIADGVVLVMKNVIRAVEPLADRRISVKAITRSVAGGDRMLPPTVSSDYLAVKICTPLIHLRTAAAPKNP